jgi:hypothetical protein
MRTVFSFIAHGLNRGLYGLFRIYTQNHFNGFPEGACKKLTTHSGFFKSGIYRKAMASVVRHAEP